MSMRYADFLRCTLALVMTLSLTLFYPLQAWPFFFGGVSIKDEKEMGRKFDVMIRASLPMVEDPEVTQYVNYMLRRLTGKMPPQPFSFKAAVIRHNALNAFAVPGGYVFLFTGMMMNVEREEDLAGVLAHELAHVTQRHVASRLERAQYLTVGSLLLAVAGVAVGGPGGGALAMGALGGSQSAMLSYSRLDETEADQIGLQFLTAAGYPPNGMVGGFKVMRQKSWMAGASIPTYLSTHPALGDRINGLQARIEGMPTHIRTRHQDNARFQRVKTLLWARYGDSQAALQRFSGQDALSCMGKGMVLSRLNRINEASRAFDQALAASPGDALILREAGAFHYRKGDMGKAETLLGKAMRKDRNDYMAAFFYARMLDETGRQNQATSYYQEVLRHVPEEPDVHEAFARSLGKGGKTLEAYIHLAYSAIYSNNRKQAERHFKKAQSLAEHTPNRVAFQKLESVYKERKEVWEES